MLPPLPTDSPSKTRLQWLALALVAVVTCLAYWRAFSGGMLWDDNEHVPRPELRSLDGLRRIWLEMPLPNPEPPPAWTRGATQQYYPLLYTSFWAQAQLWGDATLGYHVVNLALHLIAALLVFAVMRQLAIPGAVLAAAIFALHPVQVESVAWITEQKNTLSAVFYLGAMLAYLKFDDQRRSALYALALVLFTAGLLSKTVTATLPAALLVIFWWRRGTLTRRDVWPLIPFFLLGAAAGFYTALVERNAVGAQGAEFELSSVERGLLAGRVIWFYLGKLLWPADLMFVYPRWTIDPHQAWQWLFPLATLAMLGVLWAARRRSRAPLAGWLFFVGTLFPVLGFLNVYPFRFAYVADHFQYLASLGIIVPIAGAAAWEISRLRPAGQTVGVAACCVVVGALAWLTWQQSAMYSSAETLFSTTIKSNPESWLAQYDLGLVLSDEGRTGEALGYLKEAVRLRPDDVDPHLALSKALVAEGQVQQAMGPAKRAVELDPASAAAHNNLGALLLAQGQTSAAIEHFEVAVRKRPDLAEGHNNLGAALLATGRAEEAARELESALALDPNLPQAHTNLGDALAAQGRQEQAIVQFQIALQLRPKYPEAHDSLGLALFVTGHAQEALDHFREATQLKPEFAKAQYHLGAALLDLAQARESVAPLKEAVRIEPNYAKAWASLASAHARLGQRAEAIAAAEKARDLAKTQGLTATAQQMEQLLQSLGDGSTAPPPANSQPALPPVSP